MKTTTAGEQTKKLLTESLKKIMEHKPLNRISIKEITDGCHMQRQTFYYHFEDIYDQVKWLYEQEILSLINKEDCEEKWQEELLNLFHYLESNRHICLCTLHSVGRENMIRYVYKDIHKLSIKAIESACEERLWNDEFIKFLKQLYTVVFTGTLENWLIGGIEKTPEELVFLLDESLKNQLLGASIRGSKSV